MKKTFRVLVIDDNQKVLDRLLKRLTTYDRKFERRDYSIDLVPVHIRIETTEIETEAAKENSENSNQYFSKISAHTLEKLEAASKKTFSLILADFGYATEEVFNLLGNPPNGKKFTKADLEGKVLTTADLAKAAGEHSSKLKKNFVNSSAKFYLYSYVSEKFNFAFGSMSDRVNSTKGWFRNCEVVPVDTKDEFYGGDEFNALYNPEYYTHQASKLINRIIQHEFVEFILKDSQRKRYTKLKQAASIIGILTIVGFASEWLGKFVFKIYEKGDFLQGVVIVLFSVIALVFIGGVISYFVEEKIAKTMAEEDDVRDMEG